MSRHLWQPRQASAAAKPLEQRRERLVHLLTGADADILRFSEAFDDAVKLFDAAANELFGMKAFRFAAVVAAVMLAISTSPASACAGGGWKILHLEWLCCWIWGNDRKGCTQPKPATTP
jgi:hypothetical protein